LICFDFQKIWRVFFILIFEFFLKKVLEYVGPTYRTLVANLSIALFYTAGTTILPWIAWGISDWRMFSLATSIPMASVVVAYWIVPESAR
jgi:hypothetical protein